jgi:LmbE family N-acetylglucosaminyl deacetylase
MPLTLMAVHAHPDDEVISTGGTLALYSAEGVRTVVVTCTDGSQGFGPAWANPGEAGHNRDTVASVRLAELKHSCSILGVSHLETLGYRDSGMVGWSANSDPDSFSNVPLVEAAEALSELFGRYEPEVVITYDANGGYGHPDHVQSHRVTMAALANSKTVRKVYFTARSTTASGRLAELRNRLGGNRPRTQQRAMPLGVADELITSTVDVRAHVGEKRAALEAHSSQLTETIWTAVSEDEFVEYFGTETYTRVQDVTGAPLPERDLFSGLRY